MDEKKLNEQRLELKEELFEDLDEASIAAELGLDLGQIEKLKSMQPASDVSPEEQERLLDEALKFIKEEGLGRVMGE